MDDEQLIQKMLVGLEQSLPAIFTRQAASRLLGQCIAGGTLANLGKANGPPYIKRGKHAIYEKESFLQWLKKWLTGGGGSNEGENGKGS